MLATVGPPIRLAGRPRPMTEFLRELFQFIRARKALLLLPLIGTLLVLGALLVLGRGSPDAPLVYTLF